MYVSPEWQMHYRRQFDAKSLDEVAETSCDFLFFTDFRSSEQMLIENKIYNRASDPIFEVAQKIGVARKVEIIKSAVGINANTQYDTDFILPSFHRTIGHASLVDIPHNLSAQASAILPEIGITDNDVKDCIEWFFAQYRFYRQLLERYSPKIVFFLNFDAHYALIHAAKELGIMAVDLQHGVQAGWAPIYNHWQYIPRGGYDLWPDIFWVWGEYDAEKLHSALGVPTIVGGYPWLDRQRELIRETPPKIFTKVTAKRLMLEQIAEEKLATAKRVLEQMEAKELTADTLVLEKATAEETSADKWVLQQAALEEVVREVKIGLISLQDQPNFPNLFQQIIEKTSDRIVWVIRRHPKHKSISLTQLKGKAFFDSSLDKTSFLTLIDEVDINLTECSTSVIDADYVGVPSVVVGRQGLENYEDFIEAGSVYHIETADDFMEQLDDILEAPKKHRMNVVDNSRTEEALRTLLKEAHARSDY
eukprot:g9084.t1